MSLRPSLALDPADALRPSARVTTVGELLEGDRLNTNPSNWELIPRALLPRLGGRYGRGYDWAPAELKPTIMSLVKLEQQLSKKGKKEGER